MLHVPQVLQVFLGRLWAVDEAVPQMQVAGERANQHGKEQHRQRQDRPAHVLEYPTQTDRPPGVRDVVDHRPEQRAERDVEGEHVAEQVRVEELLRAGERPDDEHDAGREQHREQDARAGRGRLGQRGDAVRQPVRVGERRGAAVGAVDARGAHPGSNSPTPDLAVGVRQSITSYQRPDCHTRIAIRVYMRRSPTGPTRPSVDVRSRASGGRRWSRC